MNTARVSILFDRQPEGVVVACILTGDPEIDQGLPAYLQRTGVDYVDFKPEVIASQMFTLPLTTSGSLERTLELIGAYYVSWGKEPAIAPLNDVIGDVIV